MSSVMKSMNQLQYQIEIKRTSGTRSFKVYASALLCLTLRGWAGAPLRYAALLFEFY